MIGIWIVMADLKNEFNLKVIFLNRIEFNKNFRDDSYFF